MKKNNQDKIKLTQESFANLEAELKDLEERQLPEIVERIAKAREQGDLSENSEYKDAKDQQELLEVRIGEIQAILGQAQIITETKNADQINVGSKVTLADEKGKKTDFVIVSEFDKAAVAENTISAVSLIGKALMHKKAGETVKVVVPAGEKVWQVVAIK